MQDKLYVLGRWLQLLPTRWLLKYPENTGRFCAAVLALTTLALVRFGVSRIGWRKKKNVNFLKILIFAVEKCVAT